MTIQSHAPDHRDDWAINAEAAHVVGSLTGGWLCGVDFVERTAWLAFTFGDFRRHRDGQPSALFPFSLDELAVWN